MIDERVREATKRIVAHLDGWVLLDEEPHDNAAYLEGPDAVQVRVSQGWNEKGKLNFSVSLDNGLHNFEPCQAKRPQARVSMDRNPKAAARDIKRRCLDPSVPYVLNLRDKKAESDTVNDARWALLDALSEALGPEAEILDRTYYSDERGKAMDAKVLRGQNSHRASTEMQLTSGECIDFKTYEYGPDRVNVEIRHLEMDDALALCAWLRLRLWPENGQQGQLL